MRQNYFAVEYEKYIHKPINDYGNQVKINNKKFCILWTGMAFIISFYIPYIYLFNIEECAFNLLKEEKTSEILNSVFFAIW